MAKISSEEARSLIDSRTAHTIRLETTDFRWWEPHVKTKFIEVFQNDFHWLQFYWESIAPRAMYRDGGVITITELPGVVWEVPPRAIWPKNT